MVDSRYLLSGKVFGTLYAVVNAFMLLFKGSGEIQCLRIGLSTEYGKGSVHDVLAQAVCPAVVAVGIMAFRPVNDTVTGNALVDPAAIVSGYAAVSQTASDLAAVVRVCDADVFAVFLHQRVVVVHVALAAGRVVQNFTVVVHTKTSHSTPEGTTLTWQTNVLGSVPTDTVNAIRLQGFDVVGDHFLNMTVFGVQVGHADVLIDDLVSVVPVAGSTLVVEVLTVVQVAADVGFPFTCVVTCHMVRNNIHDNLHAIFMCFSTEGFQVVLRTEVVTNGEIQRLIEPVPRTCCVMGLDRRSLYAGKACLCDFRNTRRDVADFPVEAVKDVTVLDRVSQTVVTGGIDLGGTCGHQRTAESGKGRCKKCRRQEHTGNLATDTETAFGGFIVH